jgi:hypothetical protein
MSKRPFLLLAMLPFCFAVHAEAPIFDAHLHYDAADAEIFSPEQIIERLRNNNIRHALVTSAPAKHAAELYRTDPQRIIPFLGIYQEYADKADWHQDRGIPNYVRDQLRGGPWRGIGELHLFAEHRHSPVLQELVQIAARHELPLLMHADPAVIDTIYEIAPKVTVLWAHGGTFPYPDLIADYLERYPHLSVDLSMRDERIAPRGRLADDWYELFVRYPDRFMVGVDTYSTVRWRSYERALATIRRWLSQLPEDIARQLACRNAARRFTTRNSVQSGQVLPLTGGSCDMDTDHTAYDRVSYPAALSH